MIHVRWFYLGHDPESISNAGVRSAWLNRNGDVARSDIRPNYWC